MANDQHQQKDKQEDAHSNEHIADIYEKLAERAHQIFRDSSEKTLASLEVAIEKAREGLVKAGEISQSESQRLKEYLRRDIEQGAKYFDTFKEQASEKLQPGRVRANLLDLTSTLAHSASHLFDKLGEWADSTASYHTGQVTGPGTLMCRHCSKEMNFKKSGNIPPCPSCKKTEFRRIK
ncbi:hypothetical protein TDB9533_04271 [Thalassocella blandensis]|nr:hypothetical protein TDB9533_04271 [Thalassocella blandensis]